jgi:hypothetical protein
VTAFARYVVGPIILAALVTAGLGLLSGGVYGWTLFAVFPLLIGGLAAWISRPATPSRAVGIGAIAVLVATCSLLVINIEGLICIEMTLPLAIPLGALGAWLIQRADSTRPPKRGGVVAFLMLPLTSFAWDTHAIPQLFEVRSAIVINAPPEQVWKHVLSFSDLPEPHEWYFHTGLAYPIRARIEGTGPGATRYCEFSTGPFVEPIEVWDEPHLIRFGVTQNPAPMREWSPWTQLTPKHLRGYMISRQGQFRLTRLPNNQTLLEGTTWYQHGLWPATYWRWWSDAIIHRIHLRVLNHIRVLAEAASAQHPQAIH